MKILALVLVLALLAVECATDGILGMLSPFLDVSGILDDVGIDASTGDALPPVDDAYPLASAEMEVLLQMHDVCRTEQSWAMRTWCTGKNDTKLGDESDVLCPRGVLTHPCSGRILHANRSVDKDDAEFLWPWEGVRCDVYTEPTTVTHIYLPGESLRCLLAELDLSVLLSLEQLDLADNQLIGAFPDWLGEMTVLRLLNLAGNKLCGDIPSSFAGNDALESINLSDNRLTASSLAFFDAFHRLQYLDLSRNQLALEIPKRLLQSEYLKTINLSHNELRGQLPELPVFQFLESVDLSFNLLSGDLPTELSLWGREDPHDPDEDSVLQFVDVSFNTFSGTIPALSDLTALQEFVVRGNNFSGFVPDFPPKMLETVDPANFDGNSFRCPLPASLLPSNLTCTCGNGFFTTNGPMEVAMNSSDNASSSSDRQPQDVPAIPASEAPERCVRCPDGCYSNATNQSCHACPAGSVPGSLIRGAADHCDLCIPGTFANASGLNTCTTCPPGTSASYRGAVSCEPCFPGEFAAIYGSTQCSPCPVGAYTDDRGASAYSLCPKGTYGNVEGAAECLSCPTDSYQDRTGAASCKKCPEGYVARQSGSWQCVVCPRGSFHDATTKTCALCAPGTHSPSEAQMKCSSCKGGTVAEGYGSVECLQVATAGRGYNSSSPYAALASECKPGTFNDGTWRTCQLCAPGTFAELQGSTTCTLCPRGSFASSRGAERCEEAPVGYYVGFQGATRATPCAPGFVASMTGSVACMLCEKPSFSLLGGGSGCSVAEAGQVYERVVWPRMQFELAGVASTDLLGGEDSEILVDVFLAAWTDSLAGYLVSDRRLHLLSVDSETPSDAVLRIVVAVETVSSQTPEKSGKWLTALQNAENVVQDAVKDLVGAFGNGGSHEDQGEDQQLAALADSSAFREALVRQLTRAGLLGENVSPNLLQLSVLEPPLNATRAVSCPAGTFLQAGEALGDGGDFRERRCEPCPAGSFSESSGAMTCTLCPSGSYTSEEGQTACSACTPGQDASPGATACVTCFLLTYECEGFWEDLLVAVALALALLRVVYVKLRACSGHPTRQSETQAEAQALLTAVRVHGRTFRGERYRTMVGQQ